MVAHGARDAIGRGAGGGRRGGGRPAAAVAEAVRGAGARDGRAGNRWLGESSGWLAPR